MIAPFILGEAVDSLASNLRRASLAALGFVVGIAAVVSVIAAGQGLRVLIVKEMGSFGRPTSLVAQPDWEYLARTGWKTRPESFDAQDIEAVRECAAGVSGVSPVADFRFTVKNAQRHHVAQILAVSSDYFPMERLELSSGRPFNRSDDSSLRRAAILGAGLAELLFGADGTKPASDPLGSRIEIGEFGELEVIGVLAKEKASAFQAFSDYDTTNNGSLFVPFSAATRFGGERFAYSLRIEASDAGRVDRVSEAVLSALSIRHGTWDGQPKFAVRSGKSALDEMDKMTGLVTALISAVAGISLLVAGIGVMNVMLISVKERTREIGTRKAIGARSSWIRLQFLAEALIICSGGSILGVALASIAAFIVQSVMHWESLVPAATPLWALAGSALIAVLFGFIPARRASKLEAAEALRYE
jgi:putative ABC transport system permease protein